MIHRTLRPTLPTLLVLIGCAPAAPRVLLDPPRDVPSVWNDKKLYHTPGAYLYAASDAAAGEADAWVREVRDYIRKKHHRELSKGLVVVMEPDDTPTAATIDDVLALERDPSVMHVVPRRQKTSSEIRARMKENGVPEPAMARGSTVPLPPAKRQAMNLSVPDAAWAVAAPSHALALDCGVEVGAAAFRRQRPDISDAKAREAASMMKSALAKGFEVTRGDAVFILWAQQQSDWTYEYMKHAILSRLRHTCRTHWLPGPKDDDLEW